MRTLSRAFPKLFWAFVTSFKSCVMASKRALTGFCKVVMAMPIL